MEVNQWGLTVIKKKELDDPGLTGIRRETFEIKTTKKKSYFSAYTEILVLSEIEGLDKAGRVCHTLKYQPRFVLTSNSMKLKAEDVPTSEDLHLSNTKRCKVCDAKYSSLTELELHMEDHKKSTQNCSEVEKNKASKEMKTTDSQKHVCNLCGSEYVRKQSLKSHMRIHTGETPYACKICGKSFRRSDWLALHVNTHRDRQSERSQGQLKPTENHPCDQCGKLFRKKHGLQEHMRTHTGVKPYKCSICQMMFYSNNCYQRHQDCHSDYRPYSCSECGNSFKRLSTLNKHKRIHTGEKPFSCSCCGKLFRYKFSLSIHLKKHCSIQSHNP